MKLEHPPPHGHLTLKALLGWGICALAVWGVVFKFDMEKLK